MSLKISSAAFDPEQTIPVKYTCDGEDISPALMFENIPNNAKSLVLIFDDPDAPMGTWDHWLLFNLPPTTTQLAENIRKLPEGTEEGMNSWGRTGYGGPCPPDKMHRYYFKLYALSIKLDLPNGVKKAEIEKAMAEHILARAELMGHYDRVKR